MANEEIKVRIVDIKSLRALYTETDARLSRNHQSQVFATLGTLLYETPPPSMMTADYEKLSSAFPYFRSSLRAQHFQCPLNGDSDSLSWALHAHRSRLQ